LFFWFVLEVFGKKTLNFIKKILGGGGVAACF